MPDPLTEFREEHRRSGYECRIVTVLRTLDEDHASRLRAALAAPDIHSSAILRTLQKWGVTATYNGIRRHRAKECTCLTR